jgi:hypothetical protein
MDHIWHCGVRGRRTRFSNGRFVGCELVAVSGRLTSGQRAQIVVHCSAHYIGICDTCRLELAVSDVFPQLGGCEPNLCPRCGENIAGVLTAHINTCPFITCPFIAADLPGRASDNAPAPGETVHDTVTIPEYALVRQLFRSRRSTTKLVGWGLCRGGGCWPTTVRIDPDGRIEHVQFGVTHHHERSQAPRSGRADERG